MPGQQTTLTIPAEIVGRFCKALHLELGGAAQAISQTSLEEGQVAHPEWYTGPLERFDRLRALLDTVGWIAPEPSTALAIDLSAHRLATAAGLRCAAEIIDGGDTPEYAPVLQAALMRKLAYTAETCTLTKAQLKGWRAPRDPTEREREMLRLRMVEGLSLREIGERFGVGGGRVSQILFFAFHVRGIPPTARARRIVRRTDSESES